MTPENDHDTELLQASPIRVLVVDDEPPLRDILSRLIRVLGYEAIAASDGKIALGLLSSQRFSAVVTDVSMPGMSGPDLLREIRLQDLDIPVIFVTGVPSVESAARAVELGAFHYFTKPIDHERFTEVVKQAVDLHRMARLKRRALELTESNTKLIGDLAGLEASFQRAMSQIWLAFQPLVKAGDHSVFGYEVLLRSHDEILKFPDQVLSAAEKLNRLDELGRLIRKSAAQTMSGHPDRGSVFVNLHPNDLLDDELMSRSSPLAGIADRVVLEVTERASLHNMQMVGNRVAELKEMGYRIAVDDLGAGYAGLTAFVTLKPDIVKIDMSLVRDVDSDKVKRNLIRSLTSLCQDMGILVVAEGIETEAEHATVVELGCDLCQGYLYAKPAAPFPEVQYSPS